MSALLKKMNSKNSENSKYSGKFEFMNECGLDILKGMLNVNPNKRLKVNDIMAGIGLQNKRFLK